MALDVKVDSAKLLRFFKLTPDELKRSLHQTAGRIGSRFIGHHRARRLRGPPGVRGTRKGFLSRTHIDYTVKGTTIDQARLDIRAKTRIAVEHEEGREITARSGGNLLVPMPQNGKPMTKAQLKRARGLSKARKLILIVSKGAKYLAERRGRGPLRLLFVLVRKVTMRPRLAFFQTWREYKDSGQPRKMFFAGISFALAAARRKARAG